MQEVTRLDISRLNSDKIVRTSSGGARIPSAFTRVGVLTYRNADGTSRREFRPPEEVFAADSLASLRDASMTSQHKTCRGENMADARRYHIEAIHVKTGKVTRVSHVALDHEHACVLLSRFSPHPLRRLRLSEVKLDPTPG